MDSMLTLNTAPVAKAEMMIRRPISEVFAAFTDPAITTKFWFTKSSGKLEPGAQVKWEWEMYGVSTDVKVVALEPDKRIVIEWSEPATTAEWVFTARNENETIVSITDSGFQGSGDEQVNAAMDSSQGFTIVLCNLKALLEFGIDLNLIADKYPDANV